MEVLSGGPSVCELMRVPKLGLLFNSIYTSGARCGVLVKALRYKPAGHGFDSRCCHWNFSMT